MSPTRSEGRDRDADVGQAPFLAGAQVGDGLSCGVMLGPAWEWQVVLDGASPILGTIVVVVLAVALWFAWRRSRLERASRRAALVALRALALAAALGAALGPVIRTQKVTRDANEVVVLVDTSQSMGVSSPTRLARARALLRRSRKGLLALGEEHRVSVLTFADQISESPLDLGSPSFAETGLERAAGGTRIFEAIQAATERARDREIGALIVVSDGADHGMLEGALDPAARSRLARIGAPVHAVLMGEDRPIADLSVADVRFDPIGFVGEAVELDVRVRRRGLGTTSVPVTLLRNGRVVRDQNARFGHGSEAGVRFSFVPDRIGRSVYRVSVPLYDGDAVPENNSRDVLLKVGRDRLRILLVSGRPSWDERFLRRTFQKNPSIDLVSFFILRTLTDLPLSSSEELSLIPFPTDELFSSHLDEFDVVVFQNFEHGPYGVSPHLPRIRDWVKEGGAFVMVGGDLAFASGGYGGTALEEILPIVLAADAEEAGDLVDTATFRPDLTEEGARHPVAFLGPPGPENLRSWQALVPLEGLNVTAGPAPGAVTILEHPQRRTPDGSARAPVLAAREVGRGRTLALMTDSTWRWAFEQVDEGGEPRQYEALWENALRWLTHDPELERLRVSTDRERYAEGQPISLELRLLDRSFRPAVGQPITVELVPIDGGTPATSRSGAVDELGAYRQEWPAPGPGAYRVVARARLAARENLPEEELSAEELLLVEGPAAEMADVAPRPTLLRQVAEATGGRTVEDPPDLGRLPVEPARAVRVDRRADQPLVDRWWFFALVVAALSAEWVVRRRLGYP